MAISQPVRASPAPAGLHGTNTTMYFMKAYGRSLAAPCSTVKWVSATRWFRLVPSGTHERAGPAAITSSSVRALYISRCCESCSCARAHPKETFRPQVPDGSTRWVFQICDESVMMIRMHRHTCICGPDTRNVDIPAKACSMFSIKSPGVVSSGR
jgi:hypothetical protein